MSSDSSGVPAGRKRWSALRQAFVQLRQLARRFLLVTIILIGVLCGLVAVSFHYLIEISTRLMIETMLGLPVPLRWAAIILTPAAVAFALALAIGRWAPGAGGANLARVRAAYQHDPALLNRRSLFATFFLTPLSLGSGVPLGPEGPTVVVTSGMSVGVARLLRLPRRIVRGMIPVGTAAGIAAIFNTPIAAVVFALEEILGTARRGVLGGAIVASVAAAVVERLMLGGQPLLAAPSARWVDVRELIGFALVGIIAGIVSGSSIPLMRRWRRTLAEKIPAWPLRAAAAGAAIGAIGIVSPLIFGVGYGTVTEWLHGGGSLQESSIAFAVKTIAVIIAISAGLIGGTFAPSLFIGAALGSAVGHGFAFILPDATINPGAYALVGMGAFFAGLLRNPIASVLIVIELTQDYGLILPLMLGVALSISISRRISRFNLVEHQMRDEGYLEEGPEDPSDPTLRMRVSEVMSSNPVTVTSGSTLLDAARQIAGTRHHLYPIVDGQGHLQSLLPRDAIDEAARDGIVDRLVDDVAGDALYTAREDDRLREVLPALARFRIHRCPVVAADGSRRVVGMLTPRDLLQARLKRLETPEDRDGMEEFD
ncbi:MAG TPA: chloride channel protein [Thermoanaerobaculia bacterium]|nr:chloride channel protein [Thermoanaerobaculia bacterium]